MIHLVYTPHHQKWGRRLSKPRSDARKLEERIRSTSGRSASDTRYRRVDDHPARKLLLGNAVQVVQWLESGVSQRNIHRALQEMDIEVSRWLLQSILSHEIYEAAAAMREAETVRPTGARNTQTAHGSPNDGGVEPQPDTFREEVSHNRPAQTTEPLTAEAETSKADSEPPRTQGQRLFDVISKTRV